MINPVSSRAAVVWRPHVTVASVVARDNRYLMVEEEIGDRLMLNQPAGHLDEDEPLTAAAVRETLEETGWRIALDHLVAVHQWRSVEHGEWVLRFSFAGHLLEHEPERPLDAGIRRALWLERAEIAARAEALRSPMILSSIDAWLAGARLPLDTLHWLGAGEAAWK